MGLFSYGNESQYTAFQPECGLFFKHSSFHYAFIVYLPIAQVFGIFLNAWFVYVLAFAKPASSGNGGNKSAGGNSKLLDQSQHVYVLGSAITNVLLALGILGFWFDQLVLPCVYKGRIVCLIKNVFQFSGGYQIVFNVCLVCFDRFRLVRLGTAYHQPKEVKRAKWLLCATGVLSVAMFVIPEIIVPYVTGVSMPWPGPFNSARCTPAQQQKVWFLLGHDFIDITGITMVVGPLAFIVTFTTLTSVKLVLAQQKAAKAGSTARTRRIGVDGASGGPVINSQLAKSRKVIRASLIMFNMVGALMLTWGPYAIALIMIEAGSTAISWQIIMIFIVLLDTAPAVDPFAFALSLPKLRARAQQTRLGRFMANLLTFKPLKKTQVGPATLSSTAGTVGTAGSPSP